MKRERTIGRAWLRIFEARARKYGFQRDDTPYTLRKRAIKQRRASR